MTSGGIQIRSVKSTPMRRKKIRNNIVYEEYKFVPYFDDAEVTLTEIARLTTHICVENNIGHDYKILEFTDDALEFSDRHLFSLISESFDDLPVIQGDIKVISTNSEMINSDLPESVSVININEVNSETKALLVIKSQLFSDDRKDTLHFLLSVLQTGGFLLVREKSIDETELSRNLHNENLEFILRKKSGNEIFILVRKSVEVPKNTLIINVSNSQFSWVDRMKKIIEENLSVDTEPSCRIFLVGQGEVDNGWYKE